VSRSPTLEILGVAGLVVVIPPVANAIVWAIGAVIDYFAGFDGAHWLRFAGASVVLLGSRRLLRARRRPWAAAPVVGLLCAAALIAGIQGVFTGPDQGDAAKGAVAGAQASAFRTQRRQVVRKLLREAKRRAAHYRRHPNTRARRRTAHSLAVTHKLARQAHNTKAGRRHLTSARARLHTWERRRARLVAAHRW
jgi:hypothetical protein